MSNDLELQRLKRLLELNEATLQKVQEQKAKLKDTKERFSSLSQALRDPCELTGQLAPRLAYVANPFFATFVEAPNPDELLISEFVRQYGDPYNRMNRESDEDRLKAYMSSLESELISLGDGFDWASVADALGGAFGSSHAESDMVLRKSYSAQGCRLLWNNVILPMIKLNFNPPVVDGHRRLVTASDYTSIRPNEWPASHDQFIVREVIAARGILGRPFWDRLAKSHLLASHSQFSIISRFQSVLNPLHVMDNFKSGQSSFSLLSRAVVAQEEGTYNKMMSLKRSRADGGERRSAWTVEELAILQRIGKMTGDLQCRRSMYLTQCYALALESEYKQPCIAFSPHTSVAPRVEQKLKDYYAYDREKKSRKGAN